MKALIHSVSRASRGRVAGRLASRMLLIVAPALLVVGAVIVFPWLYTLWMSAFDWTIGSTAHYVGLGNYRMLFTNQRFGEAVLHTFYFTALAVAAPLVLGTAAAMIFHHEFPFRGVRGLGDHGAARGVDPDHDPARAAHHARASRGARASVAHRSAHRAREPARVRA